MTSIDSFVVVLIIVCLMASLALFAWAFVRYIKSKWTSQEEVYYVGKKISTEAEKRFQHFLLRIFKNHQDTLRQYDLLPQQRLANLIQILEHEYTPEAFRKISSKCVDFVFEDKNTGDVKLVIELDDKTHELEHRQRRDEFVDNALSIARIPILHVKVQARYDEDEVYNSILAKLKY